MRFETIIPTERLRPYIRQFVISESGHDQVYKVLPGGGLVLGFQYRGRLSTIEKDGSSMLATAGITGILDSFRNFKSSGNTGTVLVYFTETGLAHFSFCPANELFNQSVSLKHIFDKEKIRQTEERISLALSDQQRITAIEHFFLSQLREIRKDQLILEAVRLIYSYKGNVRITDLCRKLLISQSPLEKRFRKLVGTTPKKFASIVRFNAVLEDMKSSKSLIEICYENNFFDQAHFIHSFKEFSGDTPEQFKRDL